VSGAVPTDFEDAVRSLYAMGLPTGDIANHLADIYGTEESHLVSGSPMRSSKTCSTGSPGHSIRGGF
jgi:hypothetical protein